jgi:hypothetical protein
MAGLDAWAVPESAPRISMTIVGAPQWKRMKAGRLSVAVASFAATAQLTSHPPPESGRRPIPGERFLFIGHCGRWFINASTAGISSSADNGRPIRPDGRFDRRRAAVQPRNRRPAAIGGPFRIRTNMSSWDSPGNIEPTPFNCGRLTCYSSDLPTRMTRFPLGVATGSTAETSSRT